MTQTDDEQNAARRNDRDPSRFEYRREVAWGIIVPSAFSAATLAFFTLSYGLNHLMDVRRDLAILDSRIARIEVRVDTCAATVQETRAAFELLRQNLGVFQ